jgi:glycosyltransferase involved in cell wall biosynthesis
MDKVAQRIIQQSKSMRRKIKILYFIQLPPPVHGVAAVNDFVYHNDAINDSIIKELLEIKFSEGITELRKTTIRKIINFFRIRRQLNQTIKQTLPDCIYFSIMPVGRGFWRDLLFVHQIKRKGIKTIYHIHNRGIRRRARNIIYRRLYQYIFQQSIIIHLSESLMQQEIGGLGLKDSTTVVIPNGVPVMHYENREKRESMIRILFVSNLFPAKGLYDLLCIMKILQDDRVRTQLDVVGEFMRSRYRKGFHKMLNKLGLNNVVCLCGPRYDDEKWKAYRDADIFLFPTRFRQECFPLVILEAMQFGLPVIASRVGAIPDIIDHGKNGFILEPSDHAGFARAVKELCGNRELLNKMSSASREKFMENYTANHMETKFKQLYDNYLDDIR